MNSLSFFKRIFYSLTGKKYKEMVNSSSILAIVYLAIFELIFTLIISVLVVMNFQTFSVMEVYNYVYNFLVDFLYNSISLTFDTILVVSIIVFVVIRIILKKKIKYSRVFNLCTYSSTFGMIVKYIVFVVKYQTNNLTINYFRYIYILITIIYIAINFNVLLKLDEAKKEEIVGKE